MSNPSTKLAIVERALAGAAPTAIALALGCTTDDVANVLRVHGGSPGKLRAAAEMLRTQIAETGDVDDLTRLLRTARGSGDRNLVRLAERITTEVNDLVKLLDEHKATARRLARIDELEAELATLRSNHRCECGYLARTTNGLGIHRARRHKTVAAAS